MNNVTAYADAESQEFLEAYAPLFDYLYEKARTSNFAASLVQFFDSRGYLTSNQLAAATRMMTEDSAKATHQAAPVQSHTVQVDALERAFEKAKASGLKWPRITLRSVVVKPAGANSKNPGALYVTTTGEDKTYLGKVLRGQFTKSWDCSPAQAEEVAALLQDPKGAAEGHGRLTGNCCICSRPLTNKESVDRGIGPICAEKFGW